jgi:hypothetical protein
MNQLLSTNYAKVGNRLAENLWPWMKALAWITIYVMLIKICSFL